MPGVLVQIKVTSKLISLYSQIIRISFALVIARAIEFMRGLRQISYIYMYIYQKRAFKPQKKFNLQLRRTSNHPTDVSEVAVVRSPVAIHLSLQFVHARVG